MTVPNPHVTISTDERDVEVWYELQASMPGENDFYSCNMTADTSKGILEKLERIKAKRLETDYRAVRKTLTTEVL